MLFILSSFLISFLKIFLIIFFIRIGYFIYRKFFRKPHDLLQRYGNDSYVLITGASDGIGKEFSFQFAKRGFNLILVSRTLSKLQEVASQINKMYPNVQIKVIEYDFTKKTSKENYIETFDNAEIQSLDMSVLINNLGISQREFYSDYTLDQVYNHINANVLSQSVLMNIFIKKFLKRSKNKSAIINMSSYSGTMPLVLSSMYCSTKIFDDYLLRSVAFENQYRKQCSGNIDFLSVRPLYVDTPSRKGHKREFGPITSEMCVKGILDDLGHDIVTNGHWRHCLQAIIFDLVPVQVKNMFRYIGSRKKFKND